MEQGQQCKAARNRSNGVIAQSAEGFLLCEIVLSQKNAFVLVGRDVVVPSARRWVTRFQQPGGNLP
jgi:hypothetical protein